MNRIAELRKKNNISQKELGKIVNLNQRTISNYETGIAEPDLYTIRKLAEYFNVSIDYLLGSEEEDIILITKKDFETLKDLADKMNKIVGKLSNTSNVHIGDNTNVQIGSNISYNKGDK